MMSSRTVEENNLPTSPKDCLICGDLARGLNFSVLSCMSCKTFFRRNAYKKSLLSGCQFKSECSINKRTRSYCSPCRLKKCLALGMEPELIRIVPGSKKSSKKVTQTPTNEAKQIPLPTVISCANGNSKPDVFDLFQPRSLNLLDNDRSMLKSNEWTLLSNVLYAFDSYNPCSQIQQSLNQLSSLPPKLRTKPLEIGNIIRLLFTSTASLIECSPDFVSLPSHNRQTVVKQNVYLTSIFNTMFLARELNALDYPDLVAGCGQIYGVHVLPIARQILLRCDPNGNLMKVLTFVLIFSSNFSMVSYDGKIDISKISSSIDRVHIQNVYATVLWKYLIYLYGFKDAVARFTALIANALDLIRFVHAIPQNDARSRIFNTLVTETQRKLVIEE